MKIYATSYKTAYTKEAQLLTDILYPQKVHWFPETYKNVSSELVHPTHKLVDKVVTSETCAKLHNSKVGKCAFIFAAGNATFIGPDIFNAKKTQLSCSYKLLPIVPTQVYASRIAQACGATDLITTDATACASSLKVMCDVINLISFYQFSRVIVLSVENAVNNPTLDFFGEAGASLTSQKEINQLIKPSAFDSLNGGFYVGQGAVLTVFEAENALTSEPIMQLKGAWSASEMFNSMSGQREDGAGYKSAIEGALFYSGTVADDIAIVKTHGTGTKLNNQAEKIALTETLDKFVATSYKQKIGHTMGASGLLETMLLYEDIKQGQVPAIENRTDYDSQFLSEPIDVPDGLCLSLAAGMGNIYSAAIFDMRI